MKVYQPEFYNGVSEEIIKKSIKKEGFDPIKITNEKDYVYSSHSHPEAKLLAFLEGDMRVTVEDKEYNCTKGDRIFIPGNTTHSAIVGNNGCAFFWSEKIL